MGPRGPGVGRNAGAPWGSKIFEFHVFFARFWQNLMLPPPCQLSTPPFGQILDLLLLLEYKPSSSVSIMPCMMHVQHQHYPLWKQWMRNKYGYLIISILQLLHLCRFLDSNRTYCCLILFTLVTRINALPTPQHPPPGPE